MVPIRIAEGCNASVVVTSDTCYKNPANDTSGQYVVERLKFLNFFRVNKHIVQDDKDAITDCVRSILNDANNLLIITVGGTGLCPRDVTPEATSILYDRYCNGISTALFMTGLRYSPYAALSRLTAGISGSCLIINFPGKLKACKECLACLEGFLNHALEQVKFVPEAIKSTHREQDVIKNEIVALNAPIATSEPTPIDTNPNHLLVDICATSESLPEPPLKFYSSPCQLLEAKPSSVSILQTMEKLCEKKAQQDTLHIETVSKMPATKVASTESPYPLIHYTNALEIMSSLSYNLYHYESEVVLNSHETAYNLLGDIVATDISSKTLIPPFPVSTMDGYVLNIPTKMTKILPKIKTIQALLVKDFEKFVELQKDPTCNISFFCYRVNTGGRLPEENFAVVPVEKTGPLSTKNTVPVFEIELNKYVRTTGSDINYTDLIRAGTVIGPVELSLIQSMGHKRLKVFKKPVLGVLSTGDELIEFYDYREKELSKVIDANGPLLTSLYKMKGHSVISCGISKDNPQDILLKINTSLMKCDILVITGGASMGSKDHVKDVIEQIDGTIHFGRVNIKPGKPAALASLEREGKQKFIFSLPGNPVSAYITSVVLVIPFIEHGMRNHLESDLPLSLNDVGDLITVEIGSILDSKDQSYEFDGRLEFVRAKLSSTREHRVNSPHLVTVSLRQQSSRMLSLRDCDCLIMIEPSLKGSKFLVGQTFPALRLKN